MNLRMTIPVLLAALLAGCDSSSTTAGTSSETVTGVRLYLPSGAPASGARAELFAVSDTGNIPVSQVYVDAQGRLALDAPEKGRYNLVIRHPDGTSLLQDSLLSDGSRISAWSDTLRPAGSVQGRVKVQPKDSPRIAWVHLLGSGVYANVDDSGRFDLGGVAMGRYTVAFLTQDAAYAPTFRSARVWPDSALDLGTVELAYGGLPLVAGLAASYDAEEGLLTLKWDRSKDKRVAAYVVYEGATDSFVLHESARTADTSRSIRLFPEGGMVHPRPGFDGSYGDTTIRRQSYRVAVVDSAGTLGPAWGNVAMEMESPFRLGRQEIRWSKVGSIPGFNPYSGSRNFDNAVGCDTLLGELIAYVKDTGLAQGRAYSSPDGIAWRLLADSIPFWGGAQGGVQRGLNLPISWHGELLRVEPSVRSGSFTSFTLFALENGGWKQRSSHSLAKSADGLWLQPLGSELHLLALQSVRYGSMDPYFNLYTLRQELVWSGDAWSDGSAVFDAFAVGGEAKFMDLPKFVGGGRWTLHDPKYGEAQWARPGLISRIEDATPAPGTNINSVVGDSGEIYLLSGGAYASLSLPNRWRMLSHKGDVTPQLLASPAVLFWKGNPVIVSRDSGDIYVGTVTDP